MTACGTGPTGEAERLLRALSHRTSQGKTKIVLELLRAESTRQARIGDVVERKRKIKALVKRTTRKARNRHLTPEALIGYDEADCRSDR